MNDAGCRSLKNWTFFKTKIIHSLNFFVGGEGVHHRGEPGADRTRVGSTFLGNGREISYGPQVRRQQGTNSLRAARSHARPRGTNPLRAHSGSAYCRTWNRKVHSFGSYNFISYLWSLFTCTESPPEIVVHFEVILTLIVPCELSVFPLNFNALVLARTRESTGLFNLTVVIYECSVWHPISSVVCVRFICECRTNVCLHAVPVPSCTSYSTRWRAHSWFNESDTFSICFALFSLFHFSFILFLSFFFVSSKHCRDCFRRGSSVSCIGFC